MFQAKFKALKNKYGDKLLAIRLGDYYEFFNEDAIFLYKTIGDGTFLTQSYTRRNGVSMYGVLHNQLERLKRTMDKEIIAIDLSKEKF